MFEKILEAKGFPVKKAQKQLGLIQKELSNAGVGWQEKKKWELFDYHSSKNPFYKSLLPQRSIQDWEDIPILQKAHFQRPIQELVSNDYELKDLYSSFTSGSSGHPFYFAKDKFCHALAWSLIIDRYKWYNISLDNKQARFYGIPFNWQGYLKEKLKDLASNRVRFPVFDLSDQVLGSWVKKFERQKFRYIFGYTSSIVYFAKYLLDQQIVLKNICPSLKGCIVTSEVLSKEDRLVLEESLGVPIINEYGASELGVIAFEDHNQNWLISDELVYLEVVDYNGKQVTDGEEGRIICTSLFNFAMPLIRYEIGDIGKIETVGNRKQLVNLTGRVNDFAKLPSGRTAPGLTFYYVAKEIMSHTNVVKEFIVKQVTIDTFKIDYVSDRKLANNEIEKIEAELHKYLEKGLKIEVEAKETIERPSSGKIKHFYSEL